MGHMAWMVEKRNMYRILLESMKEEVYCLEDGGFGWRIRGLKDTDFW
jgi:hypothetical protein